MGWFSDQYNDRTEVEPKQGFFESDRDYKDRVYLEGKERIIADATAAEPKQGFFESDDSYRSRVAHEANEYIVGQQQDLAPKQGFFESDSNYRERMHHSANASVVEAATGTAPKQGFFESETTFLDRVAREASERVVEAATGSAPRQRFFEDDDDFRTRTNQSARRIKASKKTRDREESSYDYSGSTSGQGSGLGKIIGAGIFICVAFLILKSCAEDQAARQRAQEQFQQQQRIVMQYLNGAQTAAANGRFEDAENNFAQAEGLAANNLGLREQIQKTRLNYYSVLTIPQQGLSPPYPLPVAVYVTLGRGPWSKLIEARRWFATDYYWIAIDSTGRRYSPQELTTFLSRVGAEFGPFKNTDDPNLKLYFQSTNGRSKRVFIFR
jgi:hypothetical protein